MEHMHLPDTFLKTHPFAFAHTQKSVARKLKGVSTSTSSITVRSTDTPNGTQSTKKNNSNKRNRRRDAF